MTTATILDWLVAQGLWPTLLGALLYWGVPALIIWIAGRKPIRRAWAQLLGIWHEHTAAQRQLATALADHTTAQQQVAVQLARLAPREDQS